MQDLNSFKVPKGFRGRSAIFVQFWWIVESLFFSTTPQFLYGWRRLLLRCFGAKIGKGVLIRPSVKITYPWKLQIGDYSWIGDDVVLYSLGQIQIGKNVVISQRSYLCTGSHDYSAKSFDIFSKPIFIDDEVWLASDVFVHPGVTVGGGSVVGARSTITKNLPGRMLCLGSPATPIRAR